MGWDEAMKDAEHLAYVAKRQVFVRAHRGRGGKWHYGAYITKETAEFVVERRERGRANA